MKIAVTSQNKRTVTEHAGRCRKFWIYEVDEETILGRQLRDLPIDQSFHECKGRSPHPLDDIDVLITGSIGWNLRERLKQKGILALATTADDPDHAVAAFLGGTLPLAALDGIPAPHSSCRASA